MSSIVTKLLVTFSFSKENVVNGDDNNRRRPNEDIGLKGNVTSCDLDSEGDIFFDCQAWQPSDSEEDFHTPNGDQSQSTFSPVEGGKKFFQFFKDGYWDDQLVHNRKVLTVYKEIKLVRFLQDSSWPHQVHNDHRSLSVARRKPRIICGKLPDMGKASSCFKFPSISLTARWLGLRGRKKLTAPNENQ